MSMTFGELLLLRLMMCQKIFWKKQEKVTLMS